MVFLPSSIGNMSPLQLNHNQNVQNSEQLEVLGCGVFIDENNFSSIPSNVALGYLTNVQCANDPSLKMRIRLYKNVMHCKRLEELILWQFK